MGEGKPDLSEIEATVARMEASLIAPGGPAVSYAAAYAALGRRFDAELVDPRDRALARSAALMMLKVMVIRPAAASVVAPEASAGAPDPDDED